MAQTVASSLADASPVTASRRGSRTNSISARRMPLLPRHGKYRVHKIGSAKPRSASACSRRQRNALPIGRSAHYPAGMRAHHPASWLVAGLLSGCGGSSGDSPPPAPAPVPAPSRVTLAPNNYQNAVKLSMGVSSTAYLYSKLGVEVIDRWINEPLPPFPLVACPGGGTVSIELTDRNADRTLDPLDTVHFHWDRCRVQDATT